MQLEIIMEGLKTPWLVKQFALETLAAIAVKGGNNPVISITNGTRIKYKLRAGKLEPLAEMQAVSIRLHVGESKLNDLEVAELAQKSFDTASTMASGVLVRFSSGDICKGEMVNAQYIFQ